MKLKKAAVVLLSAVLIVVSLAFSAVNPFAETIKLTDQMMGIEKTTSTIGYDDKVWFVYTPGKSGYYSLYGLSKNKPRTEAYLFKKTEDENGKKQYIQLAYSNNNPYYSANPEKYPDGNEEQFCLKYHLDEGETYYYAAGWNNEGRSGAISVKFINESYDSTEIVNIIPSCNAELVWYTDGTWDTDASGEAYYLYNITKIIKLCQGISFGFYRFGKKR